MTTTHTNPSVVNQERRDLEAKRKADRLSRREELEQRRASLNEAKRQLLAMAPDRDEQLGRYIAEIDSMADRYRREFGMKKSSDALELNSHKALCYFFGDTIKERLADLVRPGGLPESERLSRLRSVQSELAEVMRELGKIIVG